MNTAVHYTQRRRGMGQTTTQIASSTAGAVGSAVGTATLGPIGGLIGAGASALAGGIADIFSGCGQTCTTASDYANVAQTSLEQNITAYFSGQISQSEALSNFNTIWSQLVAACNNPALGTAGQNCVSQRQQGSCYFSKAAAPQYPGQPAAGTCWNFYNAFYSPIANDTTMPSSAAASGGTVSVAGLPIDPTLLLIGGGAAILLLMFL
jgi:hypothetical protein